MDTQPIINNQDDEIEIDLVQLFFAFKRHIVSILAAGFLGCLVGFAFSKLVLTPMYTSTSMIYVMSKETTITSLTDLQIGAQLTQDYKVLVTNRTVMEKVIEDLSLDMNYKTLRGKITINNPQNTRILNLSVLDADPQRAKEIADEVAECASEYIADIMEQDPPKIIEYGEVPTEKTSPRNGRNALLAGLLAALAVMGLITLDVVMNDTIKTEDDVQNHFGVNVLAVIPLREDEEKKKGRQTPWGRVYKRLRRRIGKGRRKA